MKRPERVRSSFVCFLLTLLASFSFPVITKSQTPNPAALARLAEYPNLIVYNAKIYT